MIDENLFIPIRNIRSSNRRMILNDSGDTDHMGQGTWLFEGDSWITKDKRSVEYNRRYHASSEERKNIVSRQCKRIPNTESDTYRIAFLRLSTRISKTISRSLCRLDRGICLPRKTWSLLKTTPTRGERRHGWLGQNCRHVYVHVSNSQSCILWSLFLRLNPQFR